MSDIDADLRALAKQLPYDKPDADRREALRSSLLVAATEQARDPRKRWLLVGGGFAAGALAAAAIVMLVVSPRASTPVRAALARVDAPSNASLEHTVTATATGTDEVVRVRAGIVKVAVPAAKRGERVRMQTADAEVEATGHYEAVVVDDRLERVTVTDGTARITARIDGQQQHVFLSAGQTWRPKIVTADIELSSPAIVETKPAPAVVEAKSAPAAVDAKPAPAVVEAKPAPVATSKTTNAATPKAPANAATSPTNATTSKAPANAATSTTNAATSTTNAATSTTNAATSTTNAANAATSTTNAATSKAPANAATSTTNAATSKAPANAATSTTNAATSTTNAATSTTNAATSKAPTNAAAKPAAATTPKPVDPATERLPAVTELDIPSKQPTTTEKHFQAGWALLRAGKAREAAVELGAAVAGDGALAVDARYFQAVALVRAGDRVAAERVLVGFLDHAPTSLRRGRAAVMLGKLLADRGAVDTARKWFTSAANDADPAIAAAARAHLATLR